MASASQDPHAAGPLIALFGPTASGKSALALELAERFDGWVINADALQVYRELRILTARPSPEEEARLPHRLYGVLPAREACSAGRWAELAKQAIAEARAHGKLPILVGGTGLYLKALLEGLSPSPQVPEATRRSLRARLAEEGAPALYAELASRDPAAADRLAPGDGQRILRALELLDLGASFDRQPVPSGAVEKSAALIVTLEPVRDLLYRRIDARFEAMIAAGALDEASALAHIDLDPALPAMKAIGVPELLRHLDRQWSLAEATAAAQQASRRLAKRQLTWMRTQILARGEHLQSNKTSILRLQMKENSDFEVEIFPKVREFLLTAETAGG